MELAIETTGRFDIQNGTVIVDYTGASPLATIKSKIAIGYNGGAWDGYGIISSTAAAGTQFGIGYAEASAIGITTWGSCPVDSTSIILDYCLYGDSNLDGTVDYDDILALSQNYNGTNKAWWQGDFNYDGTVDYADLLALIQNNGLSGLTAAQTGKLGASLLSDFALARSIMPEPTAITTIGLAAYAIRRKRMS